MVTVKYISVIGYLDDSNFVRYIVIHAGNLFAGKHPLKIFTGAIRNSFLKSSGGDWIKDNIKQLALIKLPKPMGKHQLVEHIEGMNERGEFDKYLD